MESHTQSAQLIMIRTRHASKQPDESRRGEDGKIGKKGKTAIMGHRKQLTSSAPLVLIISSEHPARDDTKQPTASIHLTACPGRPSSFVPHPSPSHLSMSGARRHGKQATPTPDDDAKPPPSASSHPTAPHTVRYGAGNRTETGAAGRRTSTPIPTSKQARRETPDITASPLPVSNRR